MPTLHVSSNHEQIPLYAADGTSLGLRSIEAANRLIAAGSVKAAHGRKGHLKAIWLRHEDGGRPAEAQARIGTRYSFLQRLDDGGRCWKFRRLDARDEDGVQVTTRGVFFQGSRTVWSGEAVPADRPALPRYEQGETGQV
jgi:hypothetical protein